MRKKICDIMIYDNENPGYKDFYFYDFKKAYEKISSILYPTSFSYTFSVELQQEESLCLKFSGGILFIPIHSKNFKNVQKILNKVLYDVDNFREYVKVMANIPEEQHEYEIIMNHLSDEDKLYVLL